MFAILCRCWDTEYSPALSKEIALNDGRKAIFGVDMQI